MAEYMPVDPRVSASIAKQANPNYKGDPPRTDAWKDCAYDPEASGPRFHADQVQVPAELVDVTRAYSRAVLAEQKHAEQRDEALDLIAFSKTWFRQKADESVAEEQTQ